MGKEIITEPRTPNKPIIPEPKKTPLPEKPQKPVLPDREPIPGKRVFE